MLAALLDELSNVYDLRKRNSPLKLNRDSSRGISYESAWTLFPDTGKWPLVVVPKIIHFYSVPFCKASAEK
jgi:hypothetical protein